MSAHAAPPPTEAHPTAEEHDHPSNATYFKIFVILAIITAVEVWIYTIEALAAILVPLLLLLSAGKFVLVVGFYMHLKFDSRLFTYMFGFGFFIAASVITVLLLLFSQNPLPPRLPWTPPHH